jgi:predicted dehydrogenase
MSNVVTVAVLGAGNRGREAYGRYILEHPGDIRAVAIAEPVQDKRELFAHEHNIPEERQFKSWEELLARERLADGLIIATLDTMHVKPTVQAIKKGYKILLEKPIAPELRDTLEIARVARDYEADILVAHVLRYTNFYRELKKLLDKRVIGDIRYIDHLENIGYYHFAHSYVRGNWRNTDVAAPIILAKSCHDLDLIYWLLEKECLELSSHASLEYFKASNQPAGAADRCLDCQIEPECPYSARKIYLNDNSGWPVTVITTDLSYEGRYRALSEGPYGRCVFKCDNNVPEVQTVRMSFKDNVEVTFALTAFSGEINRTSKFFGTLGELRADFEHNLIEIHKFGKGIERIRLQDAPGGHGGGDTGLMNHYVKLLKGEAITRGMTTIEASVESHLMAFAAETSRKEKRVVKLEELRARG